MNTCFSRDNTTRSYDGTENQAGQFISGQGQKGIGAVMNKANENGLLFLGQHLEGG